MDIKIKTQKVIQYFLIYVLILLNGSVIYRNYQDFFLIGMLLISVFIILKKITSFQKYCYYLIPIFITLVFTVIYTKMQLSIGAVTNVMVRFLFIFAVYHYDKLNFKIRYIKMVVFLATCSLVFFILQLISPNIIMSLGFPQAYSTGTFYVNPLYCMSSWTSSIKRNVGLMTEPGLYQIILISALYLLMFHMDKMTASKQIKYIIILIIALLTTQSTTGYIGLIILLLFYYFNKRNVGVKSSVKVKVTAFLIVGIAAFIIFALLNDDFKLFQDVLFSKVFGGSGGGFDFSEGSGNARIVSMQTDLLVFQRYPLGCGYDTYYPLWQNLLVSPIGDKSSCAGITYTMAVFGILVWLAIMHFYIIGGFKNKRNMVSYLALIFLFLNTAVSQPLLYYPSFLILFVINYKDEEYAYE